MWVSPVGDQVFIEHDEPEGKSSGGIILPDRSKITVLTAKVLAISPKVRADYEYPIREGDRVVVNMNATTPINFDKRDRRYLVPASEILGIVTEERPDEDERGY